jgi:hypothetical protein
MTRAFVELEVQLHSCVDDPEQVRDELEDWLLDRYGSYDFGDIEVRITTTTP